ncbi:MAG: hypothetical protein F4166_07020 [Gammaproteobacteria bacterium]|nr:hypothetical protein [Gammaproteobacteria bacterium]
MTNYVSDKFRNFVWTEMYEIERVSRYYQELLKIHKRRAWILRGLTAILAASIAFLHFADTLFVVKIISSLLFLCLYFIEFAIGYTKVLPLSDASRGCVTVDSMLRELWRDIESASLDDDSVNFRLNQIIKTKDAIVTSHFVNAKLTEDRELNIRCAEEAKQSLLHTFQGASA